MAVTTIQQILDGQTPRVYDLGQDGVVLSYPTNTFIDDTTGVVPSSISVKALLGGVVAGTVTWTSSPSVTVTVVGNTLTIAHDQLALSGSVTITATIVYGGNTYTDSVTLLKQPGSTRVLNTNISVTSGAIQGIGTGSGTAVANNQITLSSSGTLNNAGGGTVLVGGSGNINTLSGSLNVGTLGSVIGGKANYSDSTAGFFLGYDSSAYKLKIGNSTKYLQWDGTDLTVQGNITGSVITGTSIETQVGTNSSKIFIGKSDGTQNPNANQIYITTGAASPYDVGIRIGGSNGRGIITTGVPSSGYALSAYGYSVTSIYAYNGNEGGSWAGNAIQAVSANPSSATLNVTKLPGASGAGGGYCGFFDSNNPLAETIYGRSSNNGAGGHAVRGVNSNGSGGGANTAGLIGAANGYDFYADGQGTNYGPFTGTHDALVLKNTALEIGELLVDIEVVRRNGISSTITLVETSSTANQKGVIGVVCALPKPLTATSVAAYTEGFDESGTQLLSPQLEIDALVYDHVAINALGEGQIQVCGLGGNLEPGDLIVSSSIPGKGQKQMDDIVRAITVAKCRETVVFDYPEQVKLVACIYLCG